MMKETKRVLIIILAVLFLIVGVIGLVLPFLQGVLFIILGLLLLSMYSTRARGWVDTLASKNAQLAKLIKKAEAVIERIIGKP